MEPVVDFARILVHQGNVPSPLMYAQMLVFHGVARTAPAAEGPDGTPERRTRTRECPGLKWTFTCSHSSMYVASAA